MKYFNISSLNQKHVGLIRFNGGISKTTAEKFRKGFLKLEKNVKNLESIAFVINSTGGSAVSSNIISNTLTSFCRTYDIKLMTFAEEYALSGGYWLLSAGNEVYSNKSSKVGSVGALMTSMNFREFLDKNNIDRIYLSSKKQDGSIDLNKSLDLFQHKSEEEFEVLTKMIKDVHVNFKQHVLKYRKDKLTKDNVMLEKVFNADIFVGQDAKDIGLVDELGSYRTVLKDKYPNLKIKDYSNDKEIILHELMGNVNSNSLSKLINKFI